MPGAPRSDKTFFGLHSYLAGKYCEKPKVPWVQLKVGKSGQGNNMVCRRNHPFFNNNLPPPRQFLCNKILLKKLASVRGMPIEQIFELRGPVGPLAVYVPL